MIILFAILAIAAIAGFAIPTAIRNGLPKENYTRDTRRNLTLARYVIVGVCAAIAIMVTLIMGIQVIDQTEVGVVKTFGKVDRQIYGGLNFLNPISDTLEITTRQAAVSRRRPPTASGFQAAVKCSAGSIRRCSRVAQAA